MAKSGKSTVAKQRKKKQKKYRPMRFSERLGVVIAVVLAVGISATMILYAKLIPYEYTDANGRTVKTQISLMDKFRHWKPFTGEQGTLESKEFSFAVKSEADVENSAAFDDGLDLDQIREGQFSILFLGLDEQRSNTDVMMLAMFDIAGNQIHVLQIPRDTYVPEYTSFSGGKINSVYALGDPSVSAVQRVVNCIEETFCIPIDRYITTGCADIVDIVDLIGGVPIDMPYTIHYEADKTIHAGKQTLSGQQAEWMVRYRHGYIEGDIGRMQAQRIFLAALMQKICDIGTFSLLRYADTIMDEELVYSDLSIGEMSKLADFAQTIGMERIAMYMLPGEAVNHRPGPKSDSYSVWSIHYQPAVELLNLRFRPYYQPIFELPICELIGEGNYHDTTYDHESTDLGTVIGGDHFNGG